MIASLAALVISAPNGDGHESYFPIWASRSNERDAYNGLHEDEAGNTISSNCGNTFIRREMGSINSKSEETQTSVAEFMERFDRQADMIEFMHHDKWDSALFVHWEADAEALQALLPPGLSVDTYNGKAYIGTVLLSEDGITPVIPMLPKWLTSAGAFSHYAVNARTYVRPSGGGNGGVFFFTLDCSHLIPALGAYSLFGLPYRLARMHRSRDISSNQRMFFSSSRVIGARASVEAVWSVHGIATPAQKGSLSAFLVERYYLYNEAGVVLRSLGMPHGVNLWTGRITHHPWPLQGVTLERWSSSIFEAVAGLVDTLIDPLSDPFVMYSPGVDNIRFWWAPVNKTTVVSSVQP